MSENPMTELGKKELLEEFNRMFARWGGLVGKEKQAYQQIKETLIDYPKLLKKYHALIGAINELEDRPELQKPRVSRDHIIAKLIETLAWKFSHLPDARENFVSIKISRGEFKEIKDFVEVTK